MQEHVRHQDEHCSVFAKHAAQQQHPDQKLDKIPPDSMDYKVVIRSHKKPSGHHAARFNAPIANEIAVLLFGQEHDKCGIALHHHLTSTVHVGMTWRIINVESW